MSAIAKQNRSIARPLKVLVPLIQTELDAGNNAGLDHYRRAGEMLLEAKEQVTHGSWTPWLTKNFHLSQQTARNYMMLARQMQNAIGNGDLTEVSPKSINEAIGHTQRERTKRTAYRPFQEEMRKVDQDFYAQEKQNREGEVKMRRELAEQLIDLGYKAMALRLHPDRGGSKDAMARLTDVCNQLREIARTRRFVE